MYKYWSDSPMVRYRVGDSSLGTHSPISGHIRNEYAYIFIFYTTLFCYNTFLRMPHRRQRRFFFLPYRFPIEGRTKHCGYVVLLYENEYTSTAGATTDKKLIISEKRYYLIRLRRAFVSF